MDDWEEVERRTTTPAEVGNAKQYSASMGRTDPLLFELTYLFGGEGTFREKASRIQNIPQPFIAFPPTVWHFYGGQPAPEWILKMNQVLRGNPSYFSEEVARFLGETKLITEATLLSAQASQPQEKFHPFSRPVRTLRQLSCRSTHASALWTDNRRDPRILSDCP